MTGVRLAAGLVALGLMAGCSAPGATAGTASTTTQAASPTRAASPKPSVSGALDGCLDPARARLLPPIADGGRSLQAVAIGAGSRTVILSEQSDRNLCGWLPLVPTLTAAGYQVVL
jgi:hypothetical protein